MIKVLLVIRSYFEALHIASLLEWEKKGYQFVMELNAISGLSRLHDLRPDILLLHHDVGWLDASKYSEQIHRTYLPTQIILLLGKRGAQAIDKNQFQINEGIQVIDWKSLSEAALDKALQVAVNRARMIEKGNMNVEKRRFEEIAPVSSQFSELPQSMRHENLCLMRLVAAEKLQPFTIQKQIEGVFKALLNAPHEGYWFRDKKGDYCVVLSLNVESSMYSRVEYLNDLAQTLLRSIKEILLGDAFISICYAVESNDLELQYARLMQLEPYHYFCQEADLISAFSMVCSNQPELESKIKEIIWKYYNHLVMVKEHDVQQDLQELFLELLKPVMSFEMVRHVRSVLKELTELVLFFYKLPSENSELPDSDSHDSIEEELEAWMVRTESILGNLKQAQTAYSPLVFQTLQKLLTEFSKPLAMNLIAEESGVTGAYLSRQYKAQMKIGLAENLRDIRMSFAKLLMQHGQSDISRVAEKAGYSDPKYFSRLFRREFGQTPSDFLRQHKAGE